MSSVRCVIFDCDGTLVDSELLNNVALAELLMVIGIREDPYRLMSRYKGMKLAEILSDLEVRHGKGIPPSLIPDYRARVAASFATQLKPISGVKHALEQIRIPKCVASSGPVHKIQQALAVTGLDHFFSGNILSSYEINSWKPEPDLFLAAAEKMQVPPSACVVVEDSLVGVAAALAAKMRVLYFQPDDICNGIVERGVIGFPCMSRLPALINSL